MHAVSHESTHEPYLKKNNLKIKQIKIMLKKKTSAKPVWLGGHFKIILALSQTGTVLASVLQIATRMA